MLTPEQKTKLQSAGYTPEKISAYEMTKSNPSSNSEPGYLERLGSGYKKRAEDIISDVQRPGEVAAQGGGFLDVLKAEGETALRTAGNVAGAAFDPITEALHPLVKPVVEKIATIPGVSGGIKSATDWASKHPDAAKDLGAVFDIATLGAGKGAEPIAKGLAADAAKSTAGAAAPLGRVLKGAGEAAYGVTVPMEESTSRALLNYQAKQGSLLNRIRGAVTGASEGTKPITEANTAARYGLTGTERELGIQAKQFSDKLWQKDIAPKLSSVKEATDMRHFISDLEDEIVSKTPELGRRNSLLEGLEAFAEDYKKVGKVGGDKLQEYKEGWAKFIPEATYKGKPIGSAIKEVKNMAASKARGILYDLVGENGKQAYLDYGNLQSIIDAGVKSTTGDAAKKSFSRNVWEFVMDKAVTPVATVGGKVLYRTGEGLEFVGNLGAKKVADVVK